MTGHMIDEIADYLEGRLDMKRTRNIEDHLAECAECAGAVRFAREFRTRAEEQGLVHPPPDRMIEIAADSGAMTREEREHVASCADCRAELDWVQSRPGEAGARSGGTLPGLRLVAPAAVLAIAAILCLIFLPPQLRRRDTDLAALASVEALPVRINRSAPEEGSFAEARLRMLEAYRDGDYAAAVAASNRAIELGAGDPEIRLYRGSAELILGRPAEAAADFEQGANTGPEPLRSEIDWQLAQARLLLGDKAAAREALDRAIERNGRRAEDARRLRAKLTDP